MNSPMFGGVAPSHLVTPFHALLVWACDSAQNLRQQALRRHFVIICSPVRREKIFSFAGLIDAEWLYRRREFNVGAREMVLFGRGLVA